MIIVCGLMGHRCYRIQGTIVFSLFIRNSSCFSLIRIEPPLGVLRKLLVTLRGQREPSDTSTTTSAMLRVWTWGHRRSVLWSIWCWWVAHERHSVLSSQTLQSQVLMQRCSHRIKVYQYRHFFLSFIVRENWALRSTSKPRPSAGCWQTCQLRAEQETCMSWTWSLSNHIG